MNPAIEIAELRKRFTVHVRVTQKRTALDGLSLNVAPGSVYGFLGPNGAGKTTAIKVLTSLLRPDSGSALVFGKPPSDTRARMRLGYLPETPAFYDHLTGREFLVLCGKLSGLRGAELERRADEYLERVGIAHAAGLQIRRYSKGMTQRLGIAQAILHDPDLVVLDEPMSGLDPMGRGDVRDIILDLRKRGKTVFFSTHIIPDVEAICDRVGIIAKGRLIRDGAIQDLLSEGETGTYEVVVQGLPDGFEQGRCEQVTSVGERRMLVAPSPQDLALLVERIVRAKGAIVSIVPRRASLEDLVVRLLSASESGS